MKTKLFISALLVFLSAQMLFGQQSTRGKKKTPEQNLPTQMLSKQQSDTILLDNTRMEPEWVTAFPSGASSLAGGIISLDNQGNIYLFNNGNITKCDPKGTMVWQTNTILSIKHISGYDLSETERRNYAQNIVLDHQGNLFVLANIPYGGTCRVYSADSTYIDYTITSNSVAFIKYDTNGMMQKTYWYSVVGNSANLGHISIDKNGNFYLAGWYARSTKYPPGGGIYSNVTDDNKAHPGIGYCLMKINNNMEKEWVQLGELSGRYSVAAITTDSNDNVYIAGHVTDTVKIGENYFSTSSHYHRKSIVIKFDNNGNLIWASDFSREEYGDSRFRIQKIAADTKGNSYLAENENGGNTSSLSKITPDGKIEWRILVFCPKSRNYGKYYSQSYSYFFENIVTDENDNVYFAGQGYQNIFSFPNKKTYKLDANLFVGSFNSEGELRFLKAGGGEGGGRCRSIAIHENNLFVLAGYRGIVRFGTITLVDKGKNKDDYSVWLAKYDLKKIYKK